MFKYLLYVNQPLHLGKLVLTLKWQSQNHK